MMGAEVCVAEGVAVIAGKICVNNVEPPIIAVLRRSGTTKTNLAMIHVLLVNSDPWTNALTSVAYF